MYKIGQKFITNKELVFETYSAVVPKNTKAEILDIDDEESELYYQVFFEEWKSDYKEFQGEKGNWQWVSEESIRKNLDNI